MMSPRLLLLLFAATFAHPGHDIKLEAEHPAVQTEKDNIRRKEPLPDQNLNDIKEDKTKPAETPVIVPPEMPKFAEPTAYEKATPQDVDAIIKRLEEQEKADRAKIVPQILRQLLPSRAPSNPFQGITQLIGSGNRQARTGGGASQAGVGGIISSILDSAQPRSQSQGLSGLLSGFGLSGSQGATATNAWGLGGSNIRRRQPQATPFIPSPALPDTPSSIAQTLIQDLVPRPKQLKPEIGSRIHSALPSLVQSNYGHLLVEPEPKKPIDRIRSIVLNPREGLNDIPEFVGSQIIQAASPVSVDSVAKAFPDEFGVGAEVDPERLEEVCRLIEFLGRADTVKSGVSNILSKPAGTQEILGLVQDATHDRCSFLRQLSPEDLNSLANVFQSDVGLKQRGTARSQLKEIVESIQPFINQQRQLSSSEFVDKPAFVQSRKSIAREPKQSRQVLKPVKKNSGRKGKNQAKKTQEPTIKFGPLARRFLQNEGIKESDAKQYIHENGGIGNALRKFLAADSQSAEAIQPQHSILDSFTGLLQPPQGSQASLVKNVRPALASIGGASDIRRKEPEFVPVRGILSTFLGNFREGLGI